MLQINILFVFLDHFDALMLKIIFLKKIILIYFKNKKHFKKQPQPHFQTHRKSNAWFHSMLGFFPRSIPNMGTFLFAGYSH